MLTDKNEAMISVVIERDLKLKGDRPLGADLVMKWEGAISDSVEEGKAADRAGMQSGDLLVAVNGESLRYTPLRDIEEMLRDGKDKSVSIRRKLTVFKTQ
jgi:C-terminal processing protease CtpA/Prc